jgi:hypothetical protein
MTTDAEAKRLIAKLDRGMRKMTPQGLRERAGGGDHLPVDRPLSPGAPAEGWAGRTVALDPEGGRVPHCTTDAGEAGTKNEELPGSLCQATREHNPH